MNGSEVALGSLDLPHVTSEDQQQQQQQQIDWIPFRPLEWTFTDNKAKHWVTILSTLLRTGRIRASCHTLDDQATTLRVRVYASVMPDSSGVSGFGAHGVRFLSLLQELNAHPDAFDNSHTTTTYRNVFGKHVLPGGFFEIFNEMPSPNPTELSDDSASGVKPFLDDLLQKPAPAGMKTTLYGYQKRSVWKILRRELLPGTLVDPEVVELVSVDGSPYYFDQSSCSISPYAPKMPDVAGGIICEDMGTGKTCICLAVITATRHIPSVVFGQHEVHSDYRRAVGQTNGFLSLRQTATELIMRNGIHWRQRRLPQTTVEELQKYPLYYRWSPTTHILAADGGLRNYGEFPVYNIYVSNTTLVIVPDNLIGQWRSEYYKHLHDGEVRLLELHNVRKIPEPKVLIHYDMVLISEWQFSREQERGSLRMKDNEINSKVSPLLLVHWKRVIVDEGHTLSNKSQRSERAGQLFRDYIWICTGTPTPHISGSDHLLRHAHPKLEGEDLKRIGIFLAQTLKLSPFAERSKLWTQLVQGAKDRHPWTLLKVEHLLNTIMVRNQQVDIQKEVTLPPLHVRPIMMDFDYYQWMAHNCQVGMISLNAILSEREGADYLFSPNNVQALHETVGNLKQSCLWYSLDLKWLQASYENCLEALDDIKTGKRRFGSDEPDLYHIESVLREALADKTFIKMMSDAQPGYVVFGLPEQVSASWGCGQGAYTKMPSGVHAAGCTLVEGHYTETLVQEVTHAKDDGNLFVHKEPGNKLQTMLEYHLDRYGFYDVKPKEKKKVKGKKSKKNEKNVKEEEEMAVEEVVAPTPLDQAQIDIPLAPRLPSPLYKQEETPAAEDTPSNGIQEGAASLPTPPATDTQSPPPTLPAPPAPSVRPSLTFYARDDFSTTKVLCSSSSKINYLIDQVCKLQQTEKCIIFSQSQAEINLITQALVIAKVNLVLYDEQKSTRGVSRDQKLTTFRTSNTINVILMHVDRAAFGINIPEASRMFFVSPVWELAKEQQAIKRAHRIGQTHPVHVEILIARDTIEHALWVRRENLRKTPNEDDFNEAQSAQFFRDGTLRDILNHANFVERPQHILREENGHYTQRIPRLATQLFISGVHANQKIQRREEQQVFTNVTTNEEVNANGEEDEEDDVDFGDPEDMEVPEHEKPGVKKRTRSVRFSEHIQIVAIDKDDDEYEMPEEKRPLKKVKLVQEERGHEALAKKVGFDTVNQRSEGAEHPQKKVRFAF